MPTHRGPGEPSLALIPELLSKYEGRQQKAGGVRENDRPLGPHDAKNRPEHEARYGETIHSCGNRLGIAGANDLPDPRYKAADGTDRGRR